MKLVDLNIVANGETATPLQRVLQEIDIIMTTGRQSILTNYDPTGGLERYLFKNGINAGTVRNRIHRLINENISTDLDFNIAVDVEFINGKAVRDILFVNIIVDGAGCHEQLSYTIS